MFINYRLQFGLFPLRSAVLMSTDALFPIADVTPETVRLYTLLRERDLGTIHVSGTRSPKTGDGFMSESLDKRVGSRHRFSRIVG